MLALGNKNVITPEWFPTMEHLRVSCPFFNTLTSNLNVTNFCRT